MNYKSQLRGWAIDRAIEARKAGFEVPDMKAYADELMAYAYVPEEDLLDCCKRLVEIIGALPGEEAQDKINELRNELDFFEEQLQVKRVANEPAVGAA